MYNFYRVIDEDKTIFRILEKNIRDELSSVSSAIKLKMLVYLRIYTIERHRY